MKGTGVLAVFPLSALVPNSEIRVVFDRTARGFSGLSCARSGRSGLPYILRRGTRLALALRKPGPKLACPPQIGWFDAVHQCVINPAIIKFDCQTA